MNLGFWCDVEHYLIRIAPDEVADRKLIQCGHESLQRVLSTLQFRSRRNIPVLSASGRCVAFEFGWSFHRVRRASVCPVMLPRKG
jgi:hypothetical protein